MCAQWPECMGPTWQHVAPPLAFMDNTQRAPTDATSVYGAGTPYELLLWYIPTPPPPVL
jgi:hypothetical protein